MTVAVGDDWMIEKVLPGIAPAFLPLISGGKATWSVAADNPLAVIAQQWARPKLICLPEYPFHGTRDFISVTSLHFNYHAQEDPEIVYKVLSDYKHGKSR